MKVEIASCYYHHNYGSMLQAYATQKIIKQLGYEAETIRCLSPIHYMVQSPARYYLHKLMDTDIVKKKIRQLKGKISMKRNAEYIANSGLLKKHGNWRMSRREGKNVQANAPAVGWRSWSGG